MQGRTQPPPPPPARVPADRKRRGLWILATLSIVAVFAAAVSVQAFLSGSTEPADALRCTLEQLDLIETGMTRDEVFDVMGSRGMLLLDQEIAGVRNRVYGYHNPDGSSIQLYFQNGALVSTAQFGFD